MSATSAACCSFAAAFCHHHSSNHSVPSEMHAPQWNWMLIMYGSVILFSLQQLASSRESHVARLNFIYCGMHAMSGLWHSSLSHFGFASLRRLVARFPLYCCFFTRRAAHSMLAVHIAFRRSEAKEKNGTFQPLYVHCSVASRDTAQAAMYITTAGVQFNDSVLNDIT